MAANNPKPEAVTSCKQAGRHKASHKTNHVFEFYVCESCGYTSLTWFDAK